MKPLIAILNDGDLVSDLFGQNAMNLDCRHAIFTDGQGLIERCGWTEALPRRASDLTAPRAPESAPNRGRVTAASGIKLLRRLPKCA